MQIKKIGILTWHYYGNVGSNLQAIAMQKNFTTQSTKAEFINYRPNYVEPFYKKIIRLICSSISDLFPELLPEILRFRSYSFQRHYMNQSLMISSYKKLENEVNQYDAVICGSDQIWAPNVLKKEYLLSFVPDEIKKFSYAASIGLNSIPACLVDIYVKYLRRFQLIGVRESQGAKLITELIPECKAKIIDVLDPTFIVPISFWNNISIQPKIKEKYLFCYFLGDNLWHREYAYNFAKRQRLKIIIYSYNKKDKKYSNKYIKYIGPREFIGYIKNANYIMTDSFHGTVFSIIYNKQFNVFNRFDDNDPICQNSRIKNIVDKFEIENAVVENNDSNYEELNYSNINKKVEYEIFRSKTFIKDIINQIGEINV